MKEKRTEKIQQRCTSLTKEKLTLLCSYYNCSAADVLEEAINNMFDYVLKLNNK